MKKQLLSKLSGFLFLAMLTAGTTTWAQNAPVANAATDILNTSCTANWIDSGAAEYRIDVSTQPDFTAIVTPSAPWINEFHYDGTGTFRFVEIVVPDAYQGTSLTLSLYDGAAGTVYQTKPFPGSFVAGGTNPNGFKVYYTTVPGMQNDTEGMALSDNAGLIQFLSYEGSFTATAGPANGATSVNVPFTETATSNAAASIRLTGLNGTKYSSFTWAAANSGSLAGAINSGQSFGTPIQPVDAFVAPYNNFPCYAGAWMLGGLDAGKTYYYRIRSIDAEGVASASSNVVMFKTLDPVVWMDNKWMKNGVQVSAPTIADDVFISDDFVFDSDVHGTFSAKTLRLRDGSITITPGTTLTVAGAIYNDMDVTDFVVENNANIIQQNSSAINGGNITVKKKGSPLYRLDYTIWSSPVVGQQLLAFSPQTIAHRFYVYDSQNDEYDSYDSSLNFEKGVGYLIRMPDSWPVISGYNEGQTAFQYEGSFKGNLNNGTVNVPILSTGNLKINMVGNPYPSPINIHDFFDINVNNLSETGAIWVWRKKNNPDATSYCTITKAGYIANTAEGGDTSGDAFEFGNEFNWVLNPGQGFYIQAKEGATNLLFTNSMRRAVNNGQFFKMDNSEEDELPVVSRIRLNIQGSAEGEFCQAIIAYADETTLGLDYGWDGGMMNNGSLQIYTSAADTNLSLQARGAFSAEDIVPVHYNAEVAGSFTISLSQMSGVFQDDQDVLLKDNVTGALHNLKESAYTFTSEAGTFANRFEIQYAPTALGINNPDAVANNVIVYKNGNSININTVNTDMQGVTVYDMRGRMLYDNQDITGNSTAIDNLISAQQVLLVQVNTAQGEKVTKKIIF